MANRLDVATSDSAWLKGVLLSAVLWLIGPSADGISIAHSMGDGPKTPFELTGRVLEASTKAPLEGAYVIAIYREQVSGMAATTSWCVKTRGMYTGADGRFHFPVEKLDGRSPYTVEAIKPGYYFKDLELPPPAVWRRQNAEAYSGRNILLAKQDPTKPSFEFSASGDEHCHHAMTRNDVEPALQYLSIEHDEAIRLGAPSPRVEATARMMQRLQLIPEKLGSTK